MLTSRGEPDGLPRWFLTHVRGWDMVRNHRGSPSDASRHVTSSLLRRGCLTPRGEPDVLAGGAERNHPGMVTSPLREGRGVHTTDREKVGMRHPGFPRDHSPRYWLGLPALNFPDLTGWGVSTGVWPHQAFQSSLLSCNRFPPTGALPWRLPRLCSSFSVGVLGASLARHPTPCLYCELDFPVFHMGAVRALSIALSDRSRGAFLASGRHFRNGDNFSSRPRRRKARKKCSSAT